jgi:hypothetical protein
MHRRFPPPWSVVRVSNGWCVSDADGRPVAFAFGDDTGQNLTPRPMTIEEARIVADSIARLPGLLPR